MEQFKQQLIELLSRLYKDKNISTGLDGISANYIVERITQLLSHDIHSGRLKESDLQKINQCFTNISHGLIDCRDISVISIMKCLHDKNYGIYPELMTR